VNGFALWLGFGAALGLWRVARGVSQQQAGVLVNIALFLLLLALIGARLFYVGVNWAYFTDHLLETPQFWRGGLGWPGAAAGAWIALLIVSARNRSPRGKRVSFGLLSDRLYPLLPPIAVAAWLGSWQIGSAYGYFVPSETWWAVPSLDETGFYNLHWPLQPLAAITLLAFFATLEGLAKKLRQPGLLSVLAISGLLLHLLAASLLRGDPGPYIEGTRMDVFIAFVYLALFVTFILFYNLVPRFFKKQSFSNS
jgi:prolipoprotein diacylglyceryltransferase